MEKRILMTERERLIEIFKTTKYKAYECTPETTVANQFSEYALNHIVDEFLKKGVIVPPCRVKENTFVKKYASIIEAQRQTGISNGSIGDCLHNRRKSAGGYLWEYAV